MKGRTLSHYSVLGEVSRGGMGIVYRAHDLKLGREVALKVLPPELLADPDRKRRFVLEARSAAALNHPHIAVVHEIDESDGVTFIAMELIDGEKLSEALKRGHLSITRSLELSAEVAEALASAHEKGVVHRDLKPANVMLTAEGHAKLIDFGLAKLIEHVVPHAEESTQTRTAGTEAGKVVGTTSYMSPEQARGDTVDHRSDVFSFGVMLYEMLASRPPFRGASGIETLSAILRDPAPPLPALGPDVPADAANEIQRLIDHCLAKDRGDRYQAMRDVVVDLRRARRLLESGVTGPALHAPGGAKRRRLVVATAVLGLILASGLVFTVVRSASGSRRAPVVFASAAPQRSSPSPPRE